MTPAERPLLFLWGFMGVGKSAVGQQLAALRAVPFVDLDEHIEHTLGHPIAHHFAHFGEDSFRETERATRVEVMDSAGCTAASAPRVVSLGGGALLNDELHAQALSQAFVVTLNATVEEIFARTRPTSDQTRPLLQGDASAAIRSLLARRKTAYAGAHAQLSTTGRTLDQVVEVLSALWMWH